MGPKKVPLWEQKGLRIEERSGEFFLRGKGVVDHGDTFASRRDPSGKLLDVSEFANSKPLRDSVSSLGIIISLGGPEQWSILKNVTAPGQEEQTRQMLDDYGIFDPEIVGFDDEHFIPTQSPEQKGIWCQTNQVDFSIEDRLGYMVDAPHYTRVIRITATTRETAEESRLARLRMEAGTLTVWEVPGWAKALRVWLDLYRDEELATAVNSKSEPKRVSLEARMLYIYQSLDPADRPRLWTLMNLDSFPALSATRRP